MKKPRKILNLVVGSSRVRCIKEFAKLDLPYRDAIRWHWLERLGRNVFRTKYRVVGSVVISGDVRDRNLYFNARDGHWAILVTEGIFSEAWLDDKRHATGRPSDLISEIVSYLATKRRKSAKSKGEATCSK